MKQVAELSSQTLTSNQKGLHQRLPKLVLKHLQSDFRKPYSQSSLAVFGEVVAYLKDLHKPLVFDSGCGVGESIFYLMEKHPQAVLIGIDKSNYRLAKHARLFTVLEKSHYLLVRADLNDFWRLASEARWRLSHHYPNAP